METISVGVYMMAPKLEFSRLILLCLLCITVFTTPVVLSKKLDSEKTLGDTIDEGIISEQTQKLLRGQFYENLGQVNNSEVLFYGQIPGGMIGFACSKIFLWMDGASSSVILKFPNSNNIAPNGVGEVCHQTNYFLGDRGTFVGVRGFQSIVYDNLWSGINLVYRITENGAKYEFLIKSYEDPEIIKLRYYGQDQLKIFDDSVKILKDGIELVDGGLFAFQEETEISISYVSSRLDTIEFELGDYDKSKLLVIDPLIYSTYIGGTHIEDEPLIFVDSTGHAYVTGKTNSLDFPTVNAYDDSFNLPQTSMDCFVLKLNSNGDDLIYSTYIGGNMDDWPVDISIDSLGNAYVCGSTTSSDFPTVNAFDDSYDPTWDIFIFKLSSDGTSLNYSTFLGGSDSDSAESMQIDSEGNVIITGGTRSWDFPTVNAFDDTYGGSGLGDCYCTKLNATGNGLIFSTFIGGSADDAGKSIVIDELNHVYIAGITSSSDFPILNAYNDTFEEPNTCFILKLNSDGLSLNYSTFITPNLSNLDLAIDSECNVYVSGQTDSQDYPTKNAYDDTYNGGAWDCFLFKMNSTGNGLVFSTYLGGSVWDGNPSIIVDSVSCIYIAGITTSSDFPVLNAYDEIINGSDIFVAKFNQTGNGLLYSTYVGGSEGTYGSESGVSIAIDTNGSVYVVGDTGAIDFPVVNAYDESANGNRDCVVFKLADSGDYDSDGISDYNETLLGTNRFSSDTDSDLMPDGWEIVQGLNATKDDAAEDPDLDDLENLYEYLNGTLPFENDTDIDLMPDGWEVLYSLDPLNASDATEDPDFDYLINADEYHFGMNPRNNDSDGDSILDGWEFDFEGPSIDATHIPVIPDQDDLVNVTATITDATKVNQSILSYSSDGLLWTNVSMTEIANEWNATIPAYQSHTSIHYKIYAQDVPGNWNISEMYSYTVGDTSPPTIDSPDDIGYEAGETSNNITWSPSDSFPSSYMVLQESSTYEAGPWTGGTIEISVDGLNPGVHNFSLVVTDTSGNSVNDTVQVTVTDTTDPTIDSPPDGGFEAGSSGYYITWSPDDLYPASYEVYVDMILNESGSWDGTDIVYSIGFMDPGVYNCTLIVYDETGNWENDTVFITVVDTTKPNIDTRADFDIEAGSAGNTIVWNGSDLYPDTYVVYRNNIEIATGFWTLNVTIGIDGLGLGWYNFTVIIFDESGLSVISMVNVTVVDTTKPYVNRPGDIIFEEGVPGRSIDWTPTDLYPSTYEILRNGNPILSNLWDGSPISISLDSLSAGSYNYTLILIDTSGNLEVDTVLVTVLDSAPPVIDSPSNIVYEAGTEGHNITWNPSDAHPDWYWIYRNSTLVDSGAWDGGDITITVNGLVVGVYNFTLVISDDTGNFADDTVYVTCVDTTPPTIESQLDISYAEFSTGNVISWNGSDLYPDTYVLYLNGIIHSSGLWNSSDDILTISVDNHTLGEYNYTIQLFDEYDQSVVDDVIVTVFDGTPPTVLGPTNIVYDEFSTGNAIEWMPRDLHPVGYVIYKNSILLSSGTWLGQNISVNIDGLSLGTHNFTLVVSDVGNNILSNSVIVYVNDGTPPTISSPQDIFYTVGQTGNQIVWLPSDLHPLQYELFQNSTSVKVGSWNTTGETITIEVDELSVGIYNYTLVVSDIGGNWIADTVFVSVIDDTSTTIATSTTTETDTSTTTTSLPADPLIIVIVIGSVGGVIVIVIIIVMKRRIQS